VLEVPQVLVVPILVVLGLIPSSGLQVCTLLRRVDWVAWLQQLLLAQLLVVWVLLVVQPQAVLVI
jgi:hypothetical protein